MKLVAVLCLLAAETVHVYAMPNGAPVAACATIQPAGPHVFTNPPNSANMSDNPFRLDLSEFVCPAGVVGYCYIPEQTYRRKLERDQGISSHSNTYNYGGCVYHCICVSYAAVGAVASTHTNKQTKTSLRDTSANSLEIM